MKKNILLMLALSLFLGCREERPISFLSEDFRTLEGERVFEDMFIGRLSSTVSSSLRTTMTGNWSLC